MLVGLTALRLGLGPDVVVEEAVAAVKAMEMELVYSFIRVSIGLPCQSRLVCDYYLRCHRVLVVVLKRNRKRDK